MIYARNRALLFLAAALEDFSAVSGLSCKIVVRKRPGQGNASPINDAARCPY
jgi:hypothetical protein